jgi:hypothetical protein
LKSGLDGFTSAGVIIGFSVDRKILIAYPPYGLNLY